MKYETRFFIQQLTVINSWKIPWSAVIFKFFFWFSDPNKKMWTLFNTHVTRTSDQDELTISTIHLKIDLKENRD